MTNIKHILVKLAGAIGLVAAIAIPAQAASITGGVAFGGGLSLTGGSDTATSTGIHFGAALVTSGTGDFSSVPTPYFTNVSFTDFSFASFPAAGVTPLWSFSTGGKNYSFDLQTLTVDTHDSTHLSLSGTGALSITGFDTTNAKWTFTAQSSTVNSPPTSFSAAVSIAPVPLPGALVLFASGIAGLASKRRFARNK